MPIQDAFYSAVVKRFKVWCVRTYELLDFRVHGYIACRGEWSYGDAVWSFCAVTM